MRSHISVSALVLAWASIGLPWQEPTGPFVKFGDAVITGFGPYKATAGPNGTKHFAVLASSGKRLHLVSKERGLVADCAKVEGDATAQGLLSKATMSGQAHIEVTRPSSNKDSKEVQTATADGSSATYSETGNTLHVAGTVVLTDIDSGARRSMHITGSSADLQLSPQSSKEVALKSGTVAGPVKMDIKGLRVENGQNGGPSKKVPFTLHTTSDKASFDYTARTITLTGHVHTTSDDPTVAEGSVSTETIRLHEDGSIESVEGQGEPGTTTIDLGAGGI